MSDRPKHFIAICLLLASVILQGCSSLHIQSDSNYLPASIFRDDVKNVLSKYGNEEVLEHSIFRPRFLSYLDTISKENGHIDMPRLQRAIDTWNSIMADSDAHIVFNPLHFDRLAGLSGNNSYCRVMSSCQITAADISEVRKWTRVNSKDLLHIEYDSEYEAAYDPSIISSLDSNHPDLHRILLQIYKDPVGKKLIEHSVQADISIRVETLADKHGYYHHSKKLIVIDPTILSYEFNLRYLIHEMVHAINTRQSNSITEEVLSELIGLDAQNRITGIPMELHPYSVFIQHLLHPEYGRLSVSNNIEQSLSNVGLEL
jgi:hypothetical protein